MNLYGVDYSLLDLGFIDDPAFMTSSRSRHGMMDDEEENLLKLSNSILKNINRTTQSPPKQHRHDGTSPLPLGMDWSLPPRNWDGPNTVWPQDFRTGWSYCVTIPSWSFFAESRDSEPVVFYRVQVGLQSPEGVTTTRPVQRRFSDFLKLSTDLKGSFKKKELPPAPPKRLSRTKGRAQLEERRCALENWMTKVLSEMDFSRSVTVACFLELEAAARSAFEELSQHVLHTNLSRNSGSSSDLLSSHSDVSLVVSTSASASINSGGSNSVSTEIGQVGNVMPTNSEFHKENPRSYDGLSPPTETDTNESLHKTSIGFSREEPHNVTSSVTPTESSNMFEARPEESTSSKYSQSLEATETVDTISSLDLQLLNDAIVVIPTAEQQRVKRLFSNMQQQLDTSKSIIARLDQELAEKQYLATKVKDLETELESSRKNGKENLEQAILIEKERNTQMQWDIEELRRTGMEMELKLKAEQDEVVQAGATKNPITQENEVLRQELDSAKEELKNLQRCHEEAGLKSKSALKLLAKEVKSLRSSQSELRQELERVEKERTEYERRLQQEKQKEEHIIAVNAKLLHEYKTLSKRLGECNVNFLIEENKLKMDSCSPSDVLDILTTNENRIGHLLTEAQLHAQEPKMPSFLENLDGDDMMTMNDELRKLLTDVFIENAILSKNAISAVRSALSVRDTSAECETIQENASLM